MAMKEMESQQPEKDLMRLSALLDGELTPQQAEAIQAGMQTDPELKREFEAINVVDALLDHWDAPELSPARNEAIRRGVLDRVQDDLATRRSGPASWKSWFSLPALNWLVHRPAFSVAAWAIAGILTGLGLLGGLNSQMQNRQPWDESARQMTMNLLPPEQAETIGRMALPAE